jgi:hypothetical protein
MAVKALDTLLALKLINFMPNLRPSDRRVLALVIEHFNRKTERCDPGLNRISALLGLCTRTAIRSIHRLEAAGLLKKIRHGGFSHRNRYEPNWLRFAEFERAWNERFGRDSKARRAELSPSPCHRGHLESDNPVNQTCKTNPHQQTYRDNRHRVRVPTLPSSRDAALVEAERRWTDELHRQFASKPMTYGEIIAQIDIGIRTAATTAEMKRRGAGLEYIFRQFKLGPPKGQANG